MAKEGEEATQDMLRMVKKGDSINGVAAKDVLTVKNAKGKMLLIPTNFFNKEDLTKQQQKAVGFVGMVEGKCDYPPQTRPRPYPHIPPRAPTGTARTSPPSRCGLPTRSASSTSTSTPRRRRKRSTSTSPTRRCSSSPRTSTSESLLTTGLAAALVAALAVPLRPPSAMLIYAPLWPRRAVLTAPF